MIIPNIALRRIVRMAVSFRLGLLLDFSRDDNTPFAGVPVTGDGWDIPVWLA
jgi:hypothetical protein